MPSLYTLASHNPAALLQYTPCPPSPNKHAMFAALYPTPCKLQPPGRPLNYSSLIILFNSYALTQSGSNSSGTMLYNPRIARRQETIAYSGTCHLNRYSPDTTGGVDPVEECGLLPSIFRNPGKLEHQLQRCSRPRCVPGSRWLS